MKNLVLTSIFCLLLLSSFAQQTWTVAQDGSGKFTTVQAALNAVSPANKKPVTIFIKHGV